MATIKLISGQIAENAIVANIEPFGDKGSRKAIAYVDGKLIEVYNSIIDGFNDIWYEQMSYEAWIITKGATRFVAGSVESEQESPTD